MHPDMLLLAERLVVAIEAMSQDVKNISAYVCDLSYCVSHFLNEKREKEPDNENDHLPSGIPSARQESAVKNEYFWQYEQSRVTSVSKLDDLEHEKTFAGNVASTSIDPKEDSVVLPPFTDAIKTERQTESEENDELYDVNNTYDSGMNNLRMSEDIKCQTLLESGREAQLHGVPSIISNAHERLNLSEFMETVGLASVPGSWETQRIKPFSISSVNGDCPTHITRHSGGESSVAKTHTLESVVQFNSGERPFQCVLCNKTYSTKGDFVVHMRVHSGERPYRCSVCQNSFMRSSDLNSHMQMHSGDRPYKCRECGKGFKKRTHVTVHMRIHTGEKPYVCTMCGYAFSQNCTLTRHMRVHAGELSKQIMREQLQSCG